MNEFLRQNRELFSNKREFLTKLREVRQKLMNNINLNSKQHQITCVDATECGFNGIENGVSREQSYTMQELLKQSDFEEQQSHKKNDAFIDKD